jgi:hypothetical protein
MIQPAMYVLDYTAVSYISHRYFERYCVRADVETSYYVLALTMLLRFVPNTRRGSFSFNLSDERSRVQCIWWSREKPRVRRDVSNLEPTKLPSSQLLMGMASTNGTSFNPVNRDCVIRVIR